MRLSPEKTKMVIVYILVVVSGFMYMQKLMPVVQSEVVVKNRKNDIEEIKPYIDELMQRREVSSLMSNYEKFEAITNLFGLKLQESANKETKGYTGPLNSWQGLLHGNKYKVLSAIREIIKHELPVQLHELELTDKKNITVVVSILGN